MEDAAGFLLSRNERTIAQQLPHLWGGGVKVGVRNEGRHEEESGKRRECGERGEDTK